MKSLYLFVVVVHGKFLLSFAWIIYRPAFGDKTLAMAKALAMAKENCNGFSKWYV